VGPRSPSCAMPGLRRQANGLRAQGAVPKRCHGLFMESGWPLAGKDTTMSTLFLTTAAFAALVMIAPIGTAHAGQMTYTPTTGGKTVTEKSVSIPLRILGPLYQTAADRCDATGDCGEQQALFWVAKVNGCAATPDGVVCSH